MVTGCIISTVVAVICGSLLVSGCVATPQPANPVTVPKGTPPTSGGIAEINRGLISPAVGPATASEDYRIGSEDMLQVTMFNVPKDSIAIAGPVAVRVSQTGVINLPLLGDVAVKGLTVSELEQLLRRLYDRYYYNPQVGVLVTDYRQKVSIIGAVQRPGEFVISGPKTLIDLLAMAGGVSPNAGAQVHLYRRGSKGKESYVIDLLVLASNPGSYNDANVNLPILAGDVVNVPLAGNFFVDGAVRTPGSYPLGRRFTLTQALATAGGLDRDLAADDIFIYRRKDPKEVQTISVNLESILAGSAVDPLIEADDVIEVPISTGRYVWQRYIYQLIFGGMTVRSFFPRPF